MSIEPDAPATAKQVDDLLVEFHQSRADLQHKIDQLQQDVTSGQDDAAQLVMKNLKSDRGVVFRKKGHETQFRFNSDMEDHIGHALTEATKLPATDATGKTIETLQEELRAGMRAIANRQKLIKIADQSEFSWEPMRATIWLITVRIRSS